MTTIKEVENAILARTDIADKTKTKYVKKFKTIIKGCNDSSFITLFNDTDYIINNYLKNKSPRTIETYIGEIMAIHYSLNILTPENLKILVSFRDKKKKENEKAIEEAKKQKEVIEKKQETFIIEEHEPEEFDTSSEISSNDYGHYCIEEPEEIIDTLKEKKIAVRYEIEKLEQRLIKLRNTLDILDEI